MLHPKFKGSLKVEEPEVSAPDTDAARLQRFLEGFKNPEARELVSAKLEQVSGVIDLMETAPSVAAAEVTIRPRSDFKPFFKPKVPVSEKTLKDHEVRLLEMVKPVRQENTALWAERALTGLMKVATVKDINFTKADIRIYQVVYRSILDEHQEKSLSLSPRPEYLHGFIVQDAIAGALGFCQKTVWRAFQKFEKAGVLASATKYTMVEQDGEFRTCAEGTVVNLLLSPEKALEGRRVWVRLQYLQQSYRNLTEDIKDGQTAFKLLSGAHHLQKRAPADSTNEPRPKCPRHLQWKQVDQAYQGFCSFMQQIVKGRKKEMGVKTYRTFSFSDLKNLSKRALSERLKDLAERLAARLSDQHSVNAYLRIFWRTVELYWEGRDYTQPAQQALEATFKDMQHSKVKTPGALFRYHLSVRGLECLLG